MEELHDFRPSLADVAATRGLCIEHPNLVAAATNSFHSLIGDIWIQAAILDMLASAINRKRPFLKFWDHQVPLPNRHTALAWFLICESGFAATMAANESFCYAALPQSIDPAAYRVEPMIPGPVMKASNRLPLITDLRAHSSQDMRAKLQNRRDMYHGTDADGSVFYSMALGVESAPTTPVLMHKSHRACADFRNWTRKEIRDMWRYRMVAMSQLLTIPHMPGSSVVLSGELGAGLIEFTRHGIGIQQKAEVAKWFNQGGQLKLIHTASPLTLNFVPNMTPPVWFGFQDHLAIRKWLEAYGAVRQEAVKDFRLGIKGDKSLDPIEVQNPAWLEMAESSGLVTGSTWNKGKSTRRQQAANDLAAAFDALTISF